ncbi:MAG: DUF418 domain-containing protein [Desulfosarcinaceae bacterium]|nr:DUF418 domain-containing protein [Desulfosarcinaceae bacterium]
MPSPEPAVAPTMPRQIGLDVARALAVFGMVIVNFKVVMGAETAGPAWLVWLVGRLDGRAAATFVILAGVGISLLTRGALRRKDLAALTRRRRSLLKRAALLFGVGLLYSPIWPADILHFYGLYILVGALVLQHRDRTLWTLAVGFATIFLVLLVVCDYERGWQWQSLTYTDFWTPAGMLRHLLFNGFHPVFPWTAFLLVGMWLGRRNLAEPGIRRRLLVGGALATLIAEVASALLTRWMLARWPAINPTDIRDLCATAPMPPTPLYLLSAGGTAVCLIGICLLVSDKLSTQAWLLRPLVATGQLALTLYVAHVILGMGLLEALGLLEHQSLPMAVGSALLFCLAAVGFSIVWRRVAERGPLEWAVRYITG